MNPFLRQKQSDNVYFTSVVDSKFRFNRISVRLFVPHGGAYAAENSLIPCLLRRGCASYPDLTLLNRKLSGLYDAALDTGISLAGSCQCVSFTATFLDDRFAFDGDRVSSDICALLRDVIFCPVLKDGFFPENDFRIEQQLLLDAIDAEMNDKRRYAMLRFGRNMFEGELSVLPRYVSREAVENLTPERVTEAYYELLKTAAVEITFIGCGDPEPVRKALSGAFASDTVRLSFSDLPVHALRPFRTVTERIPVQQAKLVCGYTSGIGRGSALDDAARVMNLVLGGSASSLLFKEVREKQHLCYYCYSSFDRSRGVLTVAAGIEEGMRQAAVDGINAQIRALQTGDFSDDLLDAARMLLIDAFNGVGDSLGSVENYTVNSVFYGCFDTPAQVLERLLKVTKEQVSEAARAFVPEMDYCLCGLEKEANEE